MVISVRMAILASSSRLGNSLLMAYVTATFPLYGGTSLATAGITTIVALRPAFCATGQNEGRKEGTRSISGLRTGVFLSITCVIGTEDSTAPFWPVPSIRGAGGGVSLCASGAPSTSAIGIVISASRRRLLGSLVRRAAVHFLPSFVAIRGPRISTATKISSGGGGVVFLTSRRTLPKAAAFIKDGVLFLFYITVLPIGESGTFVSLNSLSITVYGRTSTREGNENPAGAALLGMAMARPVANGDVSAIAIVSGISGISSGAKSRATRGQRSLGGIYSTGAALLSLAVLASSKTILIICTTAVRAGYRIGPASAAGVPVRGVAAFHGYCAFRLAYLS